MASKNKKGFTLIELAVVIAVIAILGIIIIPLFGKVTKSNKGKKELEIAQDAAQKYATYNAKTKYGDCDIIVNIGDSYYLFIDGELQAKDEENDAFASVDEINSDARYKSVSQSEWDAEKMADAAIDQVDIIYELGNIYCDEAEKVAKELLEKDSTLTNCAVLFTTGDAFLFHGGEIVDLGTAATPTYSAKLDIIKNASKCFWCKGDSKTGAWTQQTLSGINESISEVWTITNTLLDRADKAYAEYAAMNGENCTVAFKVKTEDTTNKNTTFFYYNGKISPRFVYSRASTESYKKYLGYQSVSGPKVYFQSVQGYKVTVSMTADNWFSDEVKELLEWSESDGTKRYAWTYTKS